MSKFHRIAPLMERQSLADANLLTSQLRAHLRHYGVLTSKMNSALKDVNQIQTELDQDGKPINLVKGRLDRAYDVLGDQTTEEIQKIDEAIEVLDTLYQLQAAAVLPDPAVAAAASAAPPSTVPPPRTGMTRGPYKKRKTGDGVSSSTAASPLPSSAPSPAPYPGSAQASPSTGIIPLPPLGSKGTPGPPPVAFDHPSPAASTPNSATGPPRKMTSQNRKAALDGQLPLRVGRQVAFRQPAKSGPSAQKKEEWILARVVKCIQGDKNRSVATSSSHSAYDCDSLLTLGRNFGNRYAVEDVDYDPAHPDNEQRYNTTLKSLLPLPDVEDRARTYPAAPYPVGTRVLAVYPDTTSLYHAVIESVPESSKKGVKEKTYKVAFDDDDGESRIVPVELLVEAP